VRFGRGSWFCSDLLHFLRSEEGGAGGGGVSSLKSLIDDGRGAFMMLMELSVRGNGLTCASMLQVEGVEGVVFNAVVRGAFYDVRGHVTSSQLQTAIAGHPNLTLLDLGDNRIQVRNVLKGV
jgi:hypothetical protein